MAFNRLADRHFDAANPRTSGRELPRGALSPRAVGWFVVGSARASTTCVRSRRANSSRGWLISFSAVSKRFPGGKEALHCLSFTRNNFV